MAFAILKSLISGTSCQFNADTAQPVCAPQQPIEVSENFFNSPEAMAASGFEMASAADIAPPQSAQSSAKALSRKANFFA